jgi:predicted RNA-binding Zn-ribbon protein involved in translation (DUF1610 family)
MIEYEKVVCASKREYTKKIKGKPILMKTCGHFLGMFRKGEVDSSFYCPTCGVIWNVNGNEENGYLMTEHKKGIFFETETSPRVVKR